MPVIQASPSKEVGTWDLEVEGINLGIVERIDMGDDTQYAFTDSFGWMTKLDVGNLSEAVKEVIEIIETAVKH